MLMQYFARDDGSLPEIEARFVRPEDAIRAFGLLFELGATDATRGGGRVWQMALGLERPFEGPGDAAFIITGEIDPFHVVLADIRIDGVALPELGFFVCPDSLTLDYRMGAAWGGLEVRALLRLLGFLRNAGATIHVPWWGEQGEAEFLSSLGST
jgi:hypothetical protein